MSTDGYLTRVEQDALKTLLDAIHNWIAEALDDTLTRQNRFTIGPRSGPQKRRETPLPFHAQASDAAADLNGTLMVWIEAVCQQRHYPWPGRLRNAPAAKWLAQHITGLALCDDAQDAADEITDAHKRVLRVIDRPAFRQYQGQCEICQGDLYGYRDADKITCAQCSEVIRKDVNDRRLANQLEDKLCTANELVVVIADRFGATIKPKTVHDLAYRKTNPILVRGSTYDEQKLYRAGDVFAELRKRKVIA